MDDIKVTDLDDEIVTDEYAVNEHKTTRKHSSHKKKKKKKAFFKKGLAIYLISLSVILFVLIIILWGKLSSYQKDIDSQKAILDQEMMSARQPQIAFEKYYNSMTSDDWKSAYYANNPDSLQKSEDIDVYIDENIANTSLSLWKSEEYTNESPVYSVMNETGEIARFYMSQSGDNWNVSSITLSVSGDYADAITVPAICQVYCNNILLTDSYSEASDSMTLSGYEEDIINPIEYKKYSVEGMLSTPDFLVECGISEYTIKAHEDGNYYLAFSDTTEYESTASSFVNALLYYYSQGKNSASANMTSALNYVASGSVASSIIRQSLDGVLWRYPTYTTYTTSTSPTYIISENCYFVDVKYSESGDSENPPGIYRVYFLDLGNGFKIYNFAMI